MIETRVIQLSDGRELAWSEFGALEGRVVVALHGSPGNRNDFAAVEGVAASRGIRLIAVDRPGYGHSSFDPRRTYASFARDLEQLVGHLEIERLGVVGWSSGAPNAAACAHFLRDRVAAVAVVSGPAPPHAHIVDLDTPRAMRVVKRLEVVAPRLVGSLFGAGLRRAARDPEKAVAFMRRTLPACDVVILDRPEVHAALLADLARPPAPTAGRTATQDLVLETRPWGFDLHAIAVPAHVWHGTADRTVGFANAVFQSEEIPEAVLHAVADEGHWLLYKYFDSILGAFP